MKRYRIAAIPGDGIGKEVVAAGVEVLQAVAGRDAGFQLDFDHFDWSSECYKREGALMRADGSGTLRGFDAFSSVRSARRTCLTI